ncbi:hypothetical protein [Methanosphaerula palustris]|nr:hypothetical protein [Methanosphaerula palustris]
MKKKEIGFYPGFPGIMEDYPLLIVRDTIFQMDCTHLDDHHEMRKG